MEINDDQKQYDLTKEHDWANGPSDTEEMVANDALIHLSAKKKTQNCSPRTSAIAWCEHNELSSSVHEDGANMA